MNLFRMQSNIVFSRNKRSGTYPRLPKIARTTDVIPANVLDSILGEEQPFFLDPVQPGKFRLSAELYCVAFHLTRGVEAGGAQEQVVALWPKPPSQGGNHVQIHELHSRLAG